MPRLLYALKMRMDACVQMLEHHRKDIISVNEDAVEFKKDNGSIHRFHIRSYNLMEQSLISKMEIWVWTEIQLTSL